MQRIFTLHGSEISFPRLVLADRSSLAILLARCLGLPTFDLESLKSGGKSLNVIDSAFHPILVLDFHCRLDRLDKP